jgi:hypothetical protein
MQDARHGTFLADSYLELSKPLWRLFMQLLANGAEEVWIALFAMID